MDLEEQVYIAIHKNDPIEKVVELCEKFTDGGLHICTIHKSTVLHIAIYHGKYQLAHKLLDNLKLLYGEMLSEKLTSVVNDWGYTLLHCATVNNEGIEIAKTLISLAPNLLEKGNSRGETPLFLSCRYGQSDMFDFLEGQVDSYCVENPNGLDKDAFFHRAEDGMNVLHATILKRSFDLALKIVKKYPNISKARDPRGLTPLQMIACCPTAFRSGFMNHREIPGEVLINVDTAFCKQFAILVPYEQVRQIRNNRKKALELVQVLVKIDDTWKDTYAPNSLFDNIPIRTPRAKLLKQDDDTSKVTVEIIEGNQHSNALLLAAENGCIEIVEEILKQHPLAIEQFNEKRQTLLHLVIKNRHLNIFNYIMANHKLSFEWMSRVIDDDGNSILHMVGFFNTSERSVDTRAKNPVTQLSDDLVFLENLKEKCPSSICYHYNKEMQTADEIFEYNSKKIQDDAKKWLDCTTQQGIVVAGIIVTVVFSAIYQVPGGQDDYGVPHLIHEHFFPVFTTADVLSLASALTSIVIFLFIHTSSVELDQFRRRIPLKLFTSFTFTFISVSMMMITFTSTSILVIQKQKPQISYIVVLLVVCIPVAVLAVSYIPLYIHLATGVFTLVLKILNFLRHQAICLLQRRKSEVVKSYRQL